MDSNAMSLLNVGSSLDFGALTGQQNNNHEDPEESEADDDEDQKRNEEV